MNVISAWLESKMTETIKTYQQILSLAMHWHILHQLITVATCSPAQARWFTWAGRWVALVHVNPGAIFENVSGIVFKWKSISRCSETVLQLSISLVQYVTCIPPPMHSLHVTIVIVDTSRAGNQVTLQWQTSSRHLNQQHLEWLKPGQNRDKHCVR